MQRWWVAFACALAACAQSDPDFLCGVDDNCVRDGQPGRCEPEGFCTFEDAACGGGRRFTEHSGELSNQCLRFASACRIPAAAELAWELELPVDAKFQTQPDVPYLTDARSELATTSFSRVGYCLELDDQVAYAELDDFTGGAVAEIGLPTESIFQTAVTNLTVRSNVVAPVELGTGRIELWSHCYGQGPDGVYNGDDEISEDQPDCYGSFQVHHDDTAVIAYDRWSGTDNGGDDLGIGNSPTAGNLDWTFEQNAGSYTRRFLQGFIVP